MNSSLKMARIAYDALDEKLAEDIRVIKVDEVTILADYLIIANGNNHFQVNALVEHVEEKLSGQGYDTKRKEGSKNATWVLMDYGDLIVHIFSKEDRLFYDLERIWRDGTVIARNEME